VNAAKMKFSLGVCKQEDKLALAFQKLRATLFARLLKRYFFKQERVYSSFAFVAAGEEG